MYFITTKLTYCFLSVVALQPIFTEVWGEVCCSSSRQSWKISKLWRCGKGSTVLVVPFVLKSSTADRLCLALSKACWRLGRWGSVSPYSPCIFEDSPIPSALFLREEMMVVEVRPGSMRRYPRYPMCTGTSPFLNGGVWYTLLPIAVRVHLICSSC
jgi:hypothetical protein